ncbi:hypothetical protein QA635_34240 [Bradyrhizobium brasilense]|uniref:hypothetical protein n=1 Tax=Bradyrhizobium brasilense TaxID=1419277 RepID=UPI0024B21D28|nr:hypothetical protein [Bradyrhizobium australafricanum]WFU31535.1 hypothetical protein QA635_34240 [Bradyrhizobium australafricanum]
MPDACETEAHDGECNKNACASQSHSKLELIAPIASKDEWRHIPTAGGRSSAVAGLRQRWRAPNRQCLFFARRARACCCVQLVAPGGRIGQFGPTFAQLLVSCAQPPPCLIGLLQNAGPSRDQKTTGVRIVNGTMKLIDIGAAPQASGGHIRFGEQRLRGYAYGKRDVPESELQEFEIKVTSNGKTSH